MRDLLDYARPEDYKARASVRATDADVTEVAADALALLRPQKDFKALSVSADIAAGLRVALGPQRLTQVLLNLLWNAVAAPSEPARAR